MGKQPKLTPVWMLRGKTKLLTILFIATTRVIFGFCCKMGTSRGGPEVVSVWALNFAEYGGMANAPTTRLIKI